MPVNLAPCCITPLLTCGLRGVDLDHIDIATRHAEIIGPCHRQLGVGGEAEFEPATDVVATDPAATLDLVITATAAEVTCPAAAAGFHPVDMGAGQMLRATGIVGAGEDVAHRPILVVEQAMAGVEVAFGIDAQVSGPGTAGIGSMSPAMDLMERRLKVAERVGLPVLERLERLATAVDHAAAESGEIASGKCQRWVRRGQHCSEAYGIEAEADEMIEDGKQVARCRRRRCSRCKMA